jgi:hypothetical protein
VTRPLLLPRLLLQPLLPPLLLLPPVLVLPLLPPPLLLPLVLVLVLRVMLVLLVPGSIQRQREVKHWHPALQVLLVLVRVQLPVPPSQGLRTCTHMTLL